MNVPLTALKKFLTIYRRARKKLKEPTAFTLATADRRGRPSSRVVLLKEADAHGFVFYTNHESRKGKELRQNPWVSLTFYWDGQDDQIRVEGRARPVSSAEADVYWSSRPRESQIGAWASLQSQVLNKRSTFLKRVTDFRKKFRGRSIPRPPHWSGFRVAPERIEFWKRRPFRLHERICYEKTPRGWRTILLYP